MMQSREQFVQQPPGNALPLRRVDEPEVQYVDQQDFPVLLQIRQQAFPIDLIGFGQDEMSDVRAVVSRVLHVTKRIGRRRVNLDGCSRQFFKLGTDKYRPRRSGLGRFEFV